MSNPTPSLPIVLKAAMAKHTKKLRTSMPGRVESYNTTSRMANVQPLLLEGDTDEQGERITVRLPVITNVPIIMPGSGAVRIKWPVNVGDYVWLSFCCKSLDQWLTKGGEVDPEDDRQHHITDAVAFCMHNPASPADASPMIEFKTSTIEAGGNKSLCLATDMASVKTAFNTWAPTGVLGDAQALKALFTTLIATGWPFGTTVLKGG